LQARVAAVNDELAAEHAQVRIGFFAVGNVTSGKILGVRLGMKSVTGRVDADKSHAVVNRIEKFFFALRRHRGIFVGTGFGEITGSEKQRGLERTKFRGIENPAVFGALNLEAVFLAQLGDHGLTNAKFTVGTFHHLVLEAGRFGEDEQRICRRYRRRYRKCDGSAGENAGFQEFAAI
jgi:hypothetical protein